MCRSRAAVVRYDLDGNGSVERTLSLTQVGADGLEVEIVLAGQAPTGFSAPLVQETRNVAVTGAATGVGCTAGELASAQATLTSATASGFACLRGLGLDPVAKAMEGKIAKDGVEFRCGATSGCAQVDILDGLTRGFLPTAIGVNLGTSFFSGSGACSNPDMVLFHELLHVGLGEAHSPFLDRTTFEGLATDRVYSCTDLCFRPGLATKSECGTCLGVDRCDSKCSAYADGPSDPPCDVLVDVTATTCPSTACTCCEGCPAGIRWVETMEGHASGPVGSYVRDQPAPQPGRTDHLRELESRHLSRTVRRHPHVLSAAGGRARHDHLHGHPAVSLRRDILPVPRAAADGGWSAGGAARHAGQRRRRRGQHADHLSLELLA